MRQINLNQIRDLKDAQEISEREERKRFNKRRYGTNRKRVVWNKEKETER